MSQDNYEALQKATYSSKPKKSKSKQLISKMLKKIRSKKACYGK